MNVESRIKWSLLGSLLMVSPAILNAWHGRLETTTFAKYYVVAFLFAWFATSILHRVMIYFKFDTAKRHIEANFSTPRRRRVDKTAPHASGESETVGQEESTPAPIE